MELLIVKPDAPHTKVRALVFDGMVEEEGHEYHVIHIWKRATKRFFRTTIGPEGFNRFDASLYEEPIEVADIDAATAIVKTESLIQPHMGSEL